jgi:hypothetical protein
MGLIIVILFFVALFFIARGIFNILAWAAPVLIVAAVLINYKTVLGFLKYLWDLLRRNPLMGILGVILTIIGFPIVCGFLFGKAILDRRIDRYQKAIQRHREGELIDYEDVTEREVRSDVLELDPLSAKEDPKNTYDDFFEDDTDRK